MRQRTTLPKSPAQRQQRLTVGGNNATLSFVLMAIFGYAVLSFFVLQPTKHIQQQQEQQGAVTGTDTKKQEPQHHAHAAQPNTNTSQIEPNKKMPNGTHSSVISLLQETIPETAKIRKLGEPLDTCENTLVTGYFQLRSKYPAEQYVTWMSNFLSVQDCMVVFTSSDMVETISNLRKQHASKRTVFVEMSLDDLPIARLGDKFWQHQLDIDGEKKRHRSYQLFWIWLSKSWCVVQAIRQNYFSSSKIFMWQDIGAYRNKRYNGQTIVQHPEVVPPKTILWMAHHPPVPPPDPIWNNKLDENEKKYYFHSGSQGAGEAATWLDYHEKFANTVAQFLEKGMFIGEDQCVLQSTCQQYPSLCGYIKKTDVRDNHYFGLRYALVSGGNYNVWRFPSK